MYWRTLFKRPCPGFLNAQPHLVRRNETTTSRQPRSCQTARRHTHSVFARGRLLLWCSFYDAVSTMQLLRCSFYDAVSTMQLLRCHTIDPVSRIHAHIQAAEEVIWAYDLDTLVTRGFLVPNFSKEIKIKTKIIGYQKTTHTCHTVPCIPNIDS